MDRSSNMVLVRMVLEKYRIHLTAKTISRIILRETGKVVSVQAVVRSMDLLPVHITNTSMRKYRIILSSEISQTKAPGNLDHTDSTK